MPAPSSTDEFLELIAKSGVAEEGRVRSFLQKAAGAGETTGAQRASLSPSAAARWSTRR